MGKDVDYERTKQKLDSLGQSGLLKYYFELNEDEKAGLLKDIGSIDFSLIGGKYAYDGGETGEIKPAKVKRTEEIKDNFGVYSAEGEKLLKQGKVAAVLLSGGQGTRLGFDKPKGMFDIGVTQEITIFSLLMKNVKEIASRICAYFHLFIMTSKENDAETKEFFAKKAYFGYPFDKIHFYIQDTEPVTDLNGKVLLKDKRTVLRSPNGNGGWYSSLLGAGYKDLIEREGIEWLNVFSVDNVLQKICSPEFIGATSLSGCGCGAKVIKKACAEEKVGVLCERNLKPCVVEYYEMPENLAAAKDEKGGLLYGFGVTLNYLFNVKKLDAVTDRKLPYHLAKKAVPYYKDGKTVRPDSPNALKYETLIVDMVSHMGSCLGFEIEREREFAPVKNRSGVDSIDTARELLKLNGVKL